MSRYHKPAVELAEAHNFPQIEALLTKYAQHLLEKNRVMQVRCLCALYRLLVVCVWGARSTTPHVFIIVFT